MKDSKIRFASQEDGSKIRLAPHPQSMTRAKKSFFSHEKKNTFFFDDLEDSMDIIKYVKEYYKEEKEKLFEPEKLCKIEDENDEEPESNDQLTYNNYPLVDPDDSLADQDDQTMEFY